MKRLPIAGLGLLVAKYIAVLTVALFTATANLVAMTTTLVATGLGETVFGSGGLTSTLVAQVFALLILFAAFFSAILLAVTSFARSFKEAQAYLIPLMLLSLAPGMMSLMPDLKFNGLLAVTPLVNIVLLARDIFEGEGWSVKKFQNLEGTDFAQLNGEGLRRCGQRTQLCGGNESLAPVRQRLPRDFAQEGDILFGVMEIQQPPLFAHSPRDNPVLWLLSTRPIFVTCR